MSLRHPFVLMLALFLTVPALAQRRALEVGDAAPGLNIEKWVQGGETTIDADRVYVIEFFATHDGGSRKVVPQLNELHERFFDAGLTIIAISTEETDVVERFVTQQGKGIEYTVAVDRRDGTHRAWMQAANRDDDDMPAVFIVDKRGKIQFMGSPDDASFVPTLVLVLSGRYDAKLFKQAEPMIEAAKNARKVRNWRMTFKMIDDVISTDPTVFGLFTLQKFEIMLVDMNEREQAYAYAKTLLEDYADDSGVLAALAKTIAMSPKIPDDARDLDIAMDAAKRAAAASTPNNPDAYAVQALVHYHSGRIDEAVKLQREAYFVARPDEKPGHKRVLRSYQEAARRGS